MNFFSVLISLVAVASFGETATAAPNKDAVACDNPVPSIRVTGCTRLLGQKNIPSKFLWQIHLQRSQGYANQGVPWSNSSLLGEVYLVGGKS